MDDIQSAQIHRAVKIALDHGNRLLEISEGWSKVRQVVHMEKCLSPLTKRCIEAEMPTLRYWTSPRTPQNPASEGFISDSDNVGLSFPGGQ